MYTISDFQIAYKQGDLAYHKKIDLKNNPYGYENVKNTQHPAFHWNNGFEIAQDTYEATLAYVETNWDYEQQWSIFN